MSTSVNPLAVKPDLAEEIRAHKLWFEGVPNGSIVTDDLKHLHGRQADLLEAIAATQIAVINHLIALLPEDMRADLMASIGLSTGSVTVQ